MDVLPSTKYGQGDSDLKSNWPAATEDSNVHLGAAGAVRRSDEVDMKHLPIAHDQEDDNTASSTIESISSFLGPGEDSDSSSMNDKPLQDMAIVAASTCSTPKIDPSLEGPVSPGSKDCHKQGGGDSSRRERAWALLLGFLLVAVVAVSIHVLVRAHSFSPSMRGGGHHVHVSLSQLQQHSTPEDCWLLIHRKVYDVSDYDHPGGRHLVTAFCGTDATVAFDSFHTKPLLTILTSRQVGVWSKQEHSSVSTSTPSAKTLPFFSFPELQKHNDTGGDCWTSIGGNVYNLTHATRLQIAVEGPYCGIDASSVFSTYPSNQMTELLSSHLIGFLLSDGDEQSEDDNEPTTGSSISPSELAVHNDPETDCWVAIHGSVFNMTEYAPRHAGGAASITDHCGADGTQSYDAFHEPHLLDMLTPYAVGPYVEASADGTAIQAPQAPQPRIPRDPTLPRITFEEVMQHNVSNSDCWTSANGQVFNLTNVILLLYTGEESICGTDSSAPFASYPPHVMENIMGVHRIGVLWSPTTVDVSELVLHDNKADCWLVLHGAVYDMTDYALLHPPGPLGIQAFCGADGTVAFSAFHEFDVLQIADPYVVGSFDNAISDEVLSDVPSVIIPHSELMNHDDPETDCWVVFDGTVYNMTDYTQSHPGGQATITSFCGADGSTAFHVFHGTGLLRRKAADYIVGTYDNAVDISPTAVSAAPRIIGHSELVLHNDTDTDCWVAMHETVYDMTSYLHEHPAGHRFIAHFCGDVGTIAFGAYHGVDLLGNRATQYRLGLYDDVA